MKKAYFEAISVFVKWSASHRQRSVIARSRATWQSWQAPRHCEQGPMSLGSSASFRRIVPSRDTSTTESEIPSFRDAKPHESWELVPLDELSLPGILQLWNRRFLVSGMQSRSNLGWHLVIARRDSAVAILSAEKGLLLHFEVLLSGKSSNIHTIC